ncbi:MAG: hypothetical protein ACPGYL_12630 [Rhodospirillaceae bacterium]
MPTDAPGLDQQQTDAGLNGAARAVRRSALAIALALGSVGLVACTNTPPQPVFADISFRHLEPMQFAVSRVDVRNLHTPTFTAPNVEHEMPFPPSAVAQRWALDRLKADGSGDLVMRVTIYDAAVTEKDLTVEKGLIGAFKTEQAERYDGALDVAIEIMDASGILLAHTSSKVWRHITLAENASINDREQAWYALSERMGQELDRELTAGLQNWMAAYQVQ